MNIAAIVCIIENYRINAVFAIFVIVRIKTEILAAENFQTFDSDVDYFTF